MISYSIEPRTRKYFKGYRFLSFKRNLSNKYEKNYHIRSQKLDTAKVSSKKVVHKTAEATDQLIGNKISGEIVKRNDFPINNYKNSCNNSCNNKLLVIGCDS